LGGDSEGIDDPAVEMNFQAAVDNAMASKNDVIAKLCKCCSYYRVVIEVGEDDALKDDIANSIKKHGLKMGKNIFEGHCP
jgi:sulfur relay (sulfurtransferase) complex TusBCD TusD component (DsrE family)